MSIDTLVLALGGGTGERLLPLTIERTKTAVPFGGKFKLGDLTISNVVNSGFMQIYVLTQYKSQSLSDYLVDAWNYLFIPELGHFLRSMPAQMRESEDWYGGTADAVRQNFKYVVNKWNPGTILIVSTDQVYKMDYRQMIAYHFGKGADVTVAVTKVRKEDAAKRFGVIEVDGNFRIIGFEEKPDEPKGIPGDEEHCLVSMGVYFFKTQTLGDAFNADPNPHLDFGKHVIPSLKDTKAVFAYPFYDYWSDVGTPFSLWLAHMDLVKEVPLFNLYDPKWPILSSHVGGPPVKTVTDAYGNEGQLLSSIAGAGTIISGGYVKKSVLFENVFVDGARVEESVIMGSDNEFRRQNVTGKSYLGRNAELRRVIADKDVRINSGVRLGYDPSLDQRYKQLGLVTISPEGIIIIPKGVEIKRI